MIKRCFLGWDRPFITSVTEWLWQRGASLARVLIVVPTRESGRKVRQALAHKGAMLSPQFLTAGAFGKLGAGGDRTLLYRLIWEEVVADHDWSKEGYEGYQPRNEGAGRVFAEELSGLKSKVEEYGLCFEEILERLPATHPDLGRWKFLSALERSFDRVMQQYESQEARVTTFGSLAGVSEVVFLGVSDPTEYAVRVGRQWVALGRPLTVLINAPERLAEQFDGFGRPLTEYWERYAIRWKDGEQQIYSSIDPKAQAAHVCMHLRQITMESPEFASVALGVGAEMEVDVLQGVLSEAGVTLYNPAGRPLRNWSFVEWVQLWMRYVRERKVADLGELVRWSWTEKLLQGEMYDRFELTQSWHRVSQYYKPHSVEDLRGIVCAKEDRMYGALRSVLWFTTVLEKERVRVGGGSLEALRILLERVLGGGEGSESLQAEVLYEGVSEVGRALPKELASRADFRNEYFRALSKARVQESRGEAQLEALGWLELAFESAEEILVLGMNDGVLPKTEGTSSWLPESLRALLGMKTMQDRFAHDVFYLTALLEGRRNKGRVRLYALKYGRTGDPMKPSRLLLQVPREQLARRVQHCFEERQSYALPSYPWHREWGLCVPRGSEVRQLSATKIRQYLMCPFRFYLKHVSRMQRPDPNVHEWNSMEYGSLIHAVLEEMKENPKILKERDYEIFREWLWNVLEAKIRLQFSGDLPLAFQIQRESMRQRLAFFAELEVEMRATDHQGWETIAWEVPFTMERMGMVITGIIDRVDQHEEGGYRIVDYKTGRVHDKGQKIITAENAHLAPVPKKGLPLHLAGTAVECEVRGKSYYWKDLQLPLYALAFEEKYGRYPELVYCKIAESKEETKYSYWDFTPELGSQASEALNAIVVKIQAQEFSPAVEEPEFDEYACFGFGYPLEEGMRLSEFLENEKG